MEFITLVDSSQAIENSTFKELFLSKFEYLEKTLLYFDKKGIKATVIFHCKHTNKRLQTYTEVICEDEAYKLVIENALKGFNTVHSHQDLQPE